MSGSAQNLFRYLTAIVITTVVGVLIGSMIGGISFACAGGYTVAFGIDQGCPFGMMCGLIWGILFGWLILRCGYLRSSLAALSTVVFALLPAILGMPALAWIAGMFGSLVAIPFVMAISHQ